MPLSDADAIAGAAWKVCFEHLNPDDCTDSAKYDILLAEASRIRAWANEQPAVVRDAYRRVLVVPPLPVNLEMPPSRWSIVDYAARVVENNARSRQQQAHYESIPKPP